MNRNVRTILSISKLSRVESNEKQIRKQIVTLWFIVETQKTSNGYRLQKTKGVTLYFYSSVEEGVVEKKKRKCMV